MPRYPEIHVATASRNPLALVAAVREELRLARIDQDEIERFSEEVLADPVDPRRVRAVCSQWVGSLKTA